MEYKIQDTDGTHPPITKESVIEKRGQVLTFSLQEIEVADAQNKKSKVEVEAKRAYEAAKMHNIEEHHPFVLKMTVEDLFTAHMYQEARTFVGMCDVKLKELDKAISESAEEVALIKSHIPELAKLDEVVVEPKVDGEKPTALV